MPRRPGARVNHDPRFGVPVQGLTAPRPENLLAPPAETHRQCRNAIHKNLRRVAQQPAELAGNRHKSARGKKSLAKDREVGENRFTRRCFLPGPYRYARPAFSGLCYFWAMIFSKPED
jgi:hypothetical protein